MTSWTQTHEIDVDDARVWHLGPFSIRVQRRRDEWRVETAQRADPLDGTRAFAEPSRSPLEGGELRRYPAADTQGRLEVRALLADRPVVSRTIDPVTVPPGRHVEVFVSSPIWVSLTADGALLGEYPTHRPADTWFGANTLHGTLCYAGRTNFLLSEEDMTTSPARARTRATITNRTETPIPLERIGLPLPSMRLFSREDGSLWTDAISVDCEPSGDARTRVLSEQATEPPLEHLAEARTPPEENGLVRAFTALIQL